MVLQCVVVGMVVMVDIIYFMMMLMHIPEMLPAMACIGASYGRLGELMVLMVVICPPLPQTSLRQQKRPRCRVCCHWAV